MLATRAIAYAHATLVGSEPSAGSRLAASPPRVRLVFSEPVEAALARLSLVSADGHVSRLVVASDAHDVHALTAPIDALRDGAYRLAWRIVSADGHPVEGSFVFSIGTGSTGAPPDVGTVTEATTWGPTVVGAPLAPAVLRGMGVYSLAAFAGLLLFLSWPYSGDERSSHRPLRIAKTLALAAPVLLALHFVAWIVNASPEHALGGVSASNALTTGIGRMEVVRIGLTAFASGALWLSRRARLALLFAASALVVSGASGHAAAIDPEWAAPAKALHLVGAAAWLGALLWLMTRERTDVQGFVRDAFHVSTIALIAVLVVAASGILQALFFLPSALDLVRSAYGAVLAAKVGGLLALIAFGAHHRYRVLPRLGRDASTTGSFTTSLEGEVMVISLVMLLGGFLAYVPLPRNEALAASTQTHR